jgi:hypothetical protein
LAGIVSIPHGERTGPFRQKRLRDQQVGARLGRGEAQARVGLARAVVVHQHVVGDAAHRSRHGKVRVEIGRLQRGHVAAARLRLKAVDLEGAALVQRRVRRAELARGALAHGENGECGVTLCLQRRGGECNGQHGGDGEGPHRGRIF